ncbi:MAG: cytochrome c peroxidase, partial [Burkholderiaceae bacterium]
MRHLPSALPRLAARLAWPALLLLALGPARIAPACAADAAAARTVAAPSARIASEPASFYGTFAHRPDAQALTRLGRALFFDRALSASGKLSCSSCHDPAHAFGPPNANAVQLGGATGSLPGVRAVPSLKYRQNTPPFSEHFSEDDGNDSEDMGPTGGLGWDGRSSSAHQQAAAPLLSPFEMANPDPESVVGRLKTSANAAAFREAFGKQAFDDPQRAWNGLVLALEVFQQSPSDFYPYDSKYDAFLRGRAELGPAEARGLLAFNDQARGNCALCHPSSIKEGAFPQFTDAGFIALGVPRNRAIPANAAPAYFDLGLCGPLRTDLKNRPEYCGLFKTPSLRNVALRPVFFHNGLYTRLEDAVRFYAQRDTNPRRFYPHGKYDDLPAKYRANVND